MAERGVIPRKIKGFRDIDPRLEALRWRLIRGASQIYERYGFEHWDTPVLEYAECLGKYLPDSDTLEEGIYSFRNPEPEPVLDSTGRELRDAANNVLMEHHFLALRYDLTAPLARRYAEELWGQQQQKGSKAAAPLFRRYQYGPVFRFEAKLDPGRYREFWQLDFDSVGVEQVAADAEVCCVLCDALEALGLPRGSYEIRVNSRQLHRGLFERLGLQDDATRARDILRVIDKYDKLGAEGVAQELAAGRRDPLSGAFVPGLQLPTAMIDLLLGYVESCIGVQGREQVLSRLEEQLGTTPAGRVGLGELRTIHDLLSSLGYGDDRVVFDPSVARGLAYYTGPVFEAVSNTEVRDETGAVRRFGSICGGGRYDGLVERLLGVKVPATGASIGVDRLAELLSLLEVGEPAPGPVLVLTIDPTLHREYQQIAAELRAAGLACEVYYGLQAKLKAQLAYADAKGCPVAVILGSNERDRGTVTVKNLKLGRQLSATIKDRAQWKAATDVQAEVPRPELVTTVRRMLTAR